MSQPFRFYLQSLIDYILNFNRTLRTDLTNIHDLLNTGTQGVGDDLPSGTTISPSAAIHVVTGAAAIDTITPPQGFSGPIWLIPAGTWTLTTAGNIALGATAVVNRTLCVVFNPRTQLWYPSY